MPPAPDVTRFDDGTKRVTRRGVDTKRGKADVTEAYDEQDRIVSTDATFADGYRVESRWSYPAEGRRSQVDTVRDPEGKTLGAITTTFDGERVTRTVEPINGQPQTDIWDKDGPVPTMQNVVAPALAIPILLDLVAAAIGAVIVGKAIDDTIARQGTGGVSNGRTYDHFTAPDITIAPTLPADDNPPDDETGSGRRSRWRYEGGNDQQPEDEPPPRPPEYRKRKKGLSKKEKKDDIPGWAEVARPRVGEDGKAAAKRYLDEKYGEGKWSKRGPRSEFSELQKFFDKAFEK